MRTKSTSPDRSGGIAGGELLPLSDPPEDHPSGDGIGEGLFIPPVRGFRKFLRQTDRLVERQRAAKPRAKSRKTGRASARGR